MKRSMPYGSAMMRETKRMKKGDIDLESATVQAKPRPRTKNAEKGVWVRSFWCGPAVLRCASLFCHLS